MFNYKVKIRLGDLLVHKNILKEEELADLLVKQKSLNFTKKIGELILEYGYLTKRQMLEILAEQLNLKFIDLYGIQINEKVLNMFNKNNLKKIGAIPFKETSEYIHVAVYDPLDIDAMEQLEKNIAIKPMQLYLALDNDIQHIFERLTIGDKTKIIINRVKQELNSGDFSIESDKSSIMELIEIIFENAILMGASDIHIEPSEFSVSIRNRIDGVLKESFIFDLEVYNALSSRIKVLAELDISERRRPQDGRFHMKVDGGNYDFRMSTTPTMHGESIVFRILDQGKILLKLSELGFDDEKLRILKRFTASPFGIIFVTGPTGSGKTTTLYAALNEVKSIENKVFTVEDPIEYQLPLAQQIQVAPKIGFTFAVALKSLLRQDPDIMMIGEIRELDTLNIAVQASLTGHLVFSTLHTNDAPSAITRMIQMGLEQYLIADSLVGIISQRLIRKICLNCRVEAHPTKDMLSEIAKYLPKQFKFYKGIGCAHCNNEGYKGRTLIVEILEITHALASAIADSANKEKIIQVAKSEGFKPMVLDGLVKALQGITSLDEVLRVAKGGH